MLDCVKNNSDFNNAKLAILYYGRRQMKKAEEYIALIKDDAYRQETDMSIHELVD
jgi:hypothetical protein